MTPGLVHLQRQVRRGSAVHLASDHPLRVLHRDTTLTLLDEDDTGDDQQRCEADEGEDQRTTAVEDCLALARDTRCDTGEDEEGHAVADATFGDDLAEPHDHGSTGSHDQHDDDKTEDRLVGDDVVTALEQLSACRKSDDAGRLQDCQSNGQVTRVLRHLGLAGLAFFPKFLELRNHHGQELHDDARRDVRHDADRKDRHLQQSAAGEQVDQRVDTC
ncbi:Uncharacterized protein G9444_2042 [Rhodococcus erythropolis]|uniref:Uncharacterized protein n=1 Tax=Rhodococcus erythropolis TaxID=1833 RepID=A0A6G9CRF3_RHOER|nr:Uncharacterized protein G9444_2042 [Rhodococcus erythropolis]